MIFNEEIAGKLKQEFLDFEKVIIEKINSILINEYCIPEELRNNVIKMIQYNVVGGKMIRGLFSVYSAYVSCSKWDDSLKEQALVVGWCAEILQAGFLIADDIMDNAEKRRGKDAWYKIPSIGLSSINDTFILLSLKSRLLREYISSETTLASILRLFEDIKLRTEIGQMLDLNTVNQQTKELNYQYFTMNYYNEIITNKTAYYTIFLPVYAGLVLSGKHEYFSCSLLQELCTLLGQFFQIRDDYLDVFADPSVLGKEGTDIQEGKCSWVILTVFSLCNEEERDMLIKHYGKKTSDDVTIVKKVFSKYDIRLKFIEYEKKVIERVKVILNPETCPFPEMISFFQVLNGKLFGLQI